MTDHQATGDADRRLPPVAELSVAAMILVVIGSVYVGAYLPRHAPVGLPIALIVAATALLFAGLAALSRLSEFAWDTFFLVCRWSLLGYIVILGMLEFVFLYDHIRGSQLVLMTLMLVIFALAVPIVLAFGVARYQPARPAASRD